MPCESCNTQFTIFKHKKSCSDCRRLFCLNCLDKSRKRSLCSRCVIFSTRPLTRNVLLRLKAKDLIVYLQSKHIPTAGCVEKDDLVNLVLAHVDSLTHGGGGGASSHSSGSSMPSPGSQFGSFRNYINNITSPNQSQQAPPPSQPSHSSRPQRQSSRESSNGTTFFNTGNNSGESPFTILRQSCQVILDNVTDKLATNFKFEPSSQAAGPGAASTSRSHTNSSPSSTSATSPSTTTQPGQPQQQNSSGRPRGGSWENVPRPEQPMRSGDESHAHNIPPRPKLRVPLDNIRLSESGCECSDDEESKQLRTTSQSTSNLLEDSPLLPNAAVDIDPMTAVPGTSRQPPLDEHLPTHRGRPHIPISRSKGSTLSDSSEFSSFEELNVVTEKRNPQKVTKDVPSSRPDTFSNREFPVSPRVITRRRSDGCLNGRLEMPRELSETKVEHQQKCCSRCGRKKNELKRRLKRFHEQLIALSNTQDVEVREHLEALLVYLERKRQSVLSNGNVGDGGGEESGSDSDPPVIVEQPLPRQEPMVEEQAEQEQKPEKVIYKRRFVKLDEIESSSDLEEFSVKQLKEILVLNRVDFKGCCEKKELIERVRRLLDDYHACPSVDKLPTDDLCKICMDAPIECVILECGHMATCLMCGKVLNECPICRQYIIRVVRFFRA